MSGHPRRAQLKSKCGNYNRLNRGFRVRGVDSSRVSDSQSTARARARDDAYQSAVLVDDWEPADVPVAQSKEAYHPDPSSLLPEPPRKLRCRRHQRTRIAEQARIWREMDDEHLYAAVCSATRWPVMLSGIRKQVNDEWDQRIVAAQHVSPLCGGLGTLSGQLGVRVHFVSVLASCEMELLQFACSSCNGQPKLCGPSFSCLPATPTKPEVFFDNYLLQLASQHMSAGPAAVLT